MSVRDKIFDINLRKDLMKGGKSKSKELTFLKVLQSEIQRKEDSSKKLKESEIVNILKKSIKNTQEVKAEGWEQEVKLLESFIPKQISTEEMDKILSGLIKSDPNANNIGYIMGYFNKNYSGRVDNKELSNLVNEKINK